MRTSVEGVWAVGDVTGRYQFTPIAQYQARIAVDDMFGLSDRAADYSVLPTSIFTEPELAGVGLAEHEARDRGIDHETVTHDIKYVQRSSYKEQKRGLYKIVYETGTRRVLGLHVVAPNAGGILSYATDENIWLREPDGEEFAKAVKEIVENPEKTEVKIKNALQTANENTREMSTDNLLATYDKMFEDFKKRRKLFTHE
jgi:glycosyltransferase involved in cell wall biosynthesis